MNITAQLYNHNNWAIRCVFIRDTMAPEKSKSLPNKKACYSHHEFRFLCVGAQTRMSLSRADTSPAGPWWNHI